MALVELVVLDGSVVVLVVEVVLVGGVVVVVVVVVGRAGSTGVTGSTSVVRNAPARAGTAWVVARVRVPSSPASVDDTSKATVGTLQTDEEPECGLRPLTEPAGVEPPATAARGAAFADVAAAFAVAPVATYRLGRGAPARPGSRDPSSSS